MWTKLTIPVYVYYLVHLITRERGKAKSPVYFQPHHTHAAHARARTHTHTPHTHPISVNKKLKLPPTGEFTGSRGCSASFWEEKPPFSGRKWKERLDKCGFFLRISLESSWIFRIQTCPCSRRGRRLHLAKHELIINKLHWAPHVMASLSKISTCNTHHLDLNQITPFLNTVDLQVKMPLSVLIRSPLFKHKAGKFAALWKSDHHRERSN